VTIRLAGEDIATARQLADDKASGIKHTSSFFCTKRFKTKRADRRERGSE